jgi:hypothetical protein
MALGEDLALLDVGDSESQNKSPDHSQDQLEVFIHNIYSRAKKGRFN